MAVTPSFGQIQASFYSVENLLGIQKETLQKQDFIARYFQRSCAERDQPLLLDLPGIGSTDTTMKSGKCIGKVLL